MKNLNKIFGIGLMSLSASPVLAGINTTTNVTTSSVLNTDKVEENGTGETDCCTVTYIGKNCTKNKQAIIARATDMNPKAVHLCLKTFKHNELANQHVVGCDGFEYTFPSETYAYMSCPMSPMTYKEQYMKNWENNGINEMGVGVSATLTCATNETTLSYDPFIHAGLGEEMLTKVMIPQADTAKKAMQVVADAVDKSGNAEPSIIMSIDQNEAWLMEMYSGHQYCAIKLPDDKVFVAGNEFILDTLADLGISEDNKENCIVSPGLLSLPVEKGFAQFDSTGIQDVYHLDLFKTYARPLGTRDPETGEETSNTDGCHMRTWRGYSLFDPSGDVAKSYGFDTKYAPFLTPKNENGAVRTDMDEHDIFEVYRDEFDNLIGKEGFERFTKAKKEASIRPIAVETTRAIHLMTSNPNLPKEIACNEWYCPSSGNYTPFIQINNGMNSVEGEYGYYPDRFVYDEDCSSVLFRKLNSMCWSQREKYGRPIQKLWRTYETIYDTQMEQVIEDAAKLSSMTDTRNIITNFNKHVRDVYIEVVKNVITDLTWHDMQQGHYVERNTFIPLIDIQEYLTNLGWTDFKQDGNTITFKYGSETGKLDFGSGCEREKGKLWINLKEFNNIDVSYRNNKIYVGFDALNNALDGRGEIIKININDYLDQSFNHLVWIIPLACVVAIGIGLATFFIVKNYKNKHKVFKGKK